MQKLCDLNLQGDGVHVTATERGDWRVQISRDLTIERENSVLSNITYTQHTTVPKNKISRIEIYQ